MLNVSEGHISPPTPSPRLLGVAPPKSAGSVGRRTRQSVPATTAHLRLLEAFASLLNSGQLPLHLQRLDRKCPLAQVRRKVGGVDSARGGQSAKDSPKIALPI